MIKGIVFGVCGLVLFLSSAVSSSATVVTTADGINSLEWLELSKTAGISRNEIESDYLQTGQLYDGYRYATRLETELLLDSYYTEGSGDLHDDGVDTYYHTIRLETFTAANNFLADFGVLTVYLDQGNYKQIDQYFSYFFYGSEEEKPALDSSPLGFVGIYENTLTNSQYGNFSENMGTWAEAVGFLNGSVDVGSVTHLLGGLPIDFGSLLVREVTTGPAPVPEPSTILLLGSGFAGLAIARRRKK